MVLPPAIVDQAPHLSRIVEGVLAAWPEHERFLGMRFAEGDGAPVDLAEEMAGLILSVAGENLNRYCASYRWMCETFIEEDLHFRRTGRYRRATFAEAYRDVYSNDAYLERYVEGILLSQILWQNQFDAFVFYLDSFLGRLEPETDFLEVGPGHGLLLYFATQRPEVRSVTGWDVSKGSIAATRGMLKTFGVTRPVELIEQDVDTDYSDGSMVDAVVISEVLEHLDAPDSALTRLRTVLRPGGLLYVNFPVNSPAPDHIYQLAAPEEVEDMVVKAGFRIVDRKHVPTTGYDLERARRRKVTINALIVATPD